MKYLIVLFLTFPAFAQNDNTILTDSIEEICFNKDSKLSNQEEECMLYYINCVVNKTGKWNDKQLFKCLKEKNI